MTFEEYFTALRGKRIGVVGIGVSNRPLIDLLVRFGCRVTACDKRTRQQLGETAEELESAGVSLKLGEGYLDNLDFDVIFRTPGLHPMHLENARRRGSVITSEMEAFFALCPCRTIAITGSDGKTTTSTLTSEILRDAGRRVFLGGNIGAPLLCRVPEMTAEDIAVLELSSFQLHGMRCSPDVAVVTNIFPNHLDVHPSYEDYICAKKSVFANQRPDARLVLNRDNDIAASFAQEAKCPVTWFSRRERENDGCFFDGEAIYRRGRKIVSRGEIRLPGLHNVENLMAAFCAVQDLAGDDSCRRVAMEFGGVEHRLELVRTLRGVRFYNDSIASSPTRTVAGLRSFDEKVILIAGGHDKNVPFKPLAEEITKSVKALFLTGETANKIKAAVDAEPGEKPPVFVIDDFAGAVQAAARYAREGDVVLLSPACSSFDRFRNFAERGDTFKKIVEGLN